LLKLLRERRPSAVLFATDAPAPTFRHVAFAGYKATRVGDGHTVPWAHLSALADAFAAPLVSAPGFEADDVLATAARRLGSVPRLIVSGDRDLLQLVSGDTRVLFIGARGGPHRLYDEAAVHERYGVRPSQLPSWVALVGDISDNLPGVPGVGAKTAADLLSRFGDAGGILARLPEISSTRLRQALASHAQQIALVERLATLRTDVDLPDVVSGAVTASALDSLRQVLVKLELASLVERLDKLRADDVTRDVPDSM
jgi:DNA polymerase-1